MPRGYFPVLTVWSTGITGASSEESLPEFRMAAGWESCFRSPCPKHNPLLMNRKISMCYKFQEALLGSPVNHSQCTLRREIWVVYNSLLPAAYWAQASTFALLLMNHANASVGLFCFVCDVGKWAAGKATPYPSYTQRSNCCWNVHFSHILEDTTQPCVSRSQCAHASCRRREGRLQQHQFKSLFAFPHQKAYKQPSPGLPWNEAQCSQGSEKQKLKKII